MLLSLFSGCGGLDLGFEDAGFNAGLAYDVRRFSINSWNRNRPENPVGRVGDITALTLERLDLDFGEKFIPTGVIGGPPCQSFTNANSNKIENDPREKLVSKFFTLALKLHRDRNPLDFIVMENVPELANSKYNRILKQQIRRLATAGFSVNWELVDAVDYGVPQHRKRLILVAYNRLKFPHKTWTCPTKHASRSTVRETIEGLQPPVFFKTGLNPDDFPVHSNHWCMKPKSKKFFNGSLVPGTSFGRSFRTLAWDRASHTVSYGNREVHIHPNGDRRLSVYEALKLQGFPDEFVLLGNLSEQIKQVSEAVPPPLAKAIASGIANELGYFNESTTIAA